MNPAIPWSSRLEEEVRARGANLAEALPLAGDGSDRRFFRVPGEPSLVLLHHPGSPGGAVTENDSYFRIGRHLRERGVPVPEIYAYCGEEGWMLMEDVGDLSLAECVAGARGSRGNRGLVPAGPGGSGAPAAGRHEGLRPGLVLRYPGGDPAVSYGTGVPLFCLGLPGRLSGP